MKIAVFGAGSIGVYVGVSLLAAGGDVVLIGRARMRERIAAGGVLLTDLEGRQLALEGARIPYAEDAAALAGAGLVLVTVKSADTAQAAAAIAAHAGPQALVLSLQNGIGNAAVLRAALPQHTVLSAMVPFNVAQLGRGRFHRGTAGDIMVEAAPALVPWQALFREAHLPLVERTDFDAVQWGKLLLNLNNPVNALSGLPLQAELSQRPFRRCLALLIEEALAVLRLAGIRPAQVARLAPQRLPLLLRLPDALFTRLAAAMLRIDPEARSSMAEDLEAGRRTEIDYLNGEIVRLAERLGRDAPANRRIVELVRAAEAGNARRWDGPALYRRLSQA